MQGENMINEPTNFSQIYISENDKPLPPFLEACVLSNQNIFQDCKHNLFSNEILRAFIDTHFGKEVLWAYDELNPYSYRSDLGRFCLLHKLGGWYVDIALKLIKYVDVPDNLELLSFRDFQPMTKTAWACAGGILYAKKNNPIFETAINLVIENCKNQYYGVSALCPTGPNLLGRAIATHGSNPNNMYGDVSYLTPFHPNSNKAFVLPNGDILAHFKPSSGGDLTKLGAEGVNNYNFFWQNRSVYRSVKVN
jgi:mannosyltransferase OCH1-like enzyme